MFQGLIMVVRSAITGVIITYTVYAEENTFMRNALYKYIYSGWLLYLLLL